MSKPIVRWTIGPKSFDCDDEILSVSVKRMRSLYGKTFDYFICFNGRKKFEFGHLESLGIILLDQEKISADFNPKPMGCAWKLYPPRINPEVHEIFMDHDLVVWDRLVCMDDFLNNNDFFLKIRGPRLYGRFENQVKKEFFLNSGLFGLPPRFEFDLKMVDCWREYFDDQGFIASQICKQEKILEEDVLACNRKIQVYLPKVKAYHFTHVKRNETWNQFKKYKIKML